MEMENLRRREILNQGDLYLSALSNKSDDNFRRAFKWFQINLEKLCTLESDSSCMEITMGSTSDKMQSSTS
ncbi:hypothetical protein ACS0TY_018496 [Phlomoides rotata]